MSADLELYLQNSIIKLEKALKAIVSTRGYNEESEKLKLLYELIKEQMPHEKNSRDAIGKTR